MLYNVSPNIRKNHFLLKKKFVTAILEIICNIAVTSKYLTILTSLEKITNFLSH